MKDKEGAENKEFAALWTGKNIITNGITLKPGEVKINQNAEFNSYTKLDWGVGSEISE